MNTKTALTCLLLLSVGLFSNRAVAQTVSPYADENRPAINDSPSTTAGFFWVTETSYQPVRETTVRFYDGQKQLIYEEKLTGRCLNIRRKRVVRSLNRALSDAREQWAMQRTLRQSEFFVANQLK